MSQDYREVLDRLGAIEVKVGIIETKVDELHSKNQSFKDELREHGIRDLWVQGTLLTILLFILGRLMMK